MIWEKLAQEFVVKGTVGDLIVMMFAAFIVGVFCTILVFYLWILKRQLKEKKKVGDKIKTLILISMLALIAGGCASMQTEIIADPGAIDSITVGHFTTANPVDNELIGSYLRKELAKRGFRILDNSPYVLTGTIAFYEELFRRAVFIQDASIILKKDSGEQLVQWFYSGDSVLLLGMNLKNRRDFACYMAKEITKTLK